MSHKMLVSHYTIEGSQGRNSRLKPRVKNWGRGNRDMIFTSLDCSATLGNLSKGNTDSFVGLHMSMEYQKFLYQLAYRQYNEDIFSICVTLH